MTDIIPMDMLLVILGAALATYVTRFGGYVLINRMKTIPPRMEQALNAVPAAVLTTLVAPSFFNGGWDVKIAMVAALAVCLRYPGPLDARRRLGGGDDLPPRPRPLILSTWLSGLLIDPLVRRPVRSPAPAMP